MQTPADVEYIRENFVPLDELCAARGQSSDRVRALIAAGSLPAARYVLEDGTEMVPAEYFEIEGLLAAPEREAAGWRASLRASVDELDELERPFAPNYDRARWGPSSRDRRITAARERYPEVFSAAASRG